MYFHMSKDTINQFAIARDMIRMQMDYRLSLANDHLVEHFFKLVGDRGNAMLKQQAEVIFSHLMSDNSRRSKQKELKRYMSEMEHTYAIRHTEDESLAA